MIALVNGSVESVIPLNEQALHDLARYLCEELMICDGAWSRMEDIHQRDERYEREQQANGGYCNYCKDWAGRILVKFDVEEK